MTSGEKILLPFPQTDSGQRQDIWKTSLFWEKGLQRQVVMKEQVCLEEEGLPAGLRGWPVLGCPPPSGRLGRPSSQCFHQEPPRQSWGAVPSLGPELVI